MRYWREFDRYVRAHYGDNIENVYFYPYVPKENVSHDALFVTVEYYRENGCEIEICIQESKIYGKYIVYRRIKVFVSDRYYYRQIGEWNVDIMN